MIWLLIIVVIGLAIRIVGPWSIVFTATHVNLPENDAWYHLRVIENLVAQFPHRLTVDPYAIAGGMYVPIAPLFDLLTAGAALVAGGGHPSPQLVRTVAVFVPPALAAITLVLVYAAGRDAWDRRAGLLAATMAAIVPGHFLDRTLLGYVDHHALESLCSAAILWLLIRVLQGRDSTAVAVASIACALCAYLLTWTSASFLIALIAVWLTMHLVLQAWRHADVGNVGLVVACAAAIALLVTWLTRSLNPYRIDLQIAALAALIAVAVVVEAARRLIERKRLSPALLTIGIGVLAVIGVIAVSVAAPALWSRVIGELARFTPSAERMQVLEARPLFQFDGPFSLRPAWLMFRTAFWVGVASVAVVAWFWIRSRRAVDLLLVVWTAWMIAATIAQNRFGYYLVPAIAVIAGEVSSRALEAGRRIGGWQRNAAVIAVAGVVFAPNLVPAVWTTERPAGLPASWLPAFEWLRTHTPEPFGRDEYYFARYDAAPPAVRPSAVMSWWDYGYWITEVAHRVPVSNPTQEGAADAGRFFIETDPRVALEQLRRRQASYVLMDDLLPFRVGPGGAVSGKFESLTVFAGVDHRRYYGVLAVPDRGGYRTVFVYYPDYYRSMAYRLGVLHGAATGPLSPPAVVSWQARAVPGIAGVVPVATTIEPVATMAAAEARLRELGPGNHRVVGLDPARSPFPVEGVDGLTRAFRTPDDGNFGQGAVQVFSLP